MTNPVENPTKPQNVKEIVALLAVQFPQCFSLEGPAKPLKVGIFQDLATRLAAEPLLSKTMLRQALRVYTSSWRYLEALVEGAARVDLDGTAGDCIDAQQAAHALQTLTDSKAKAAEARKVRQAEAKAKARQKEGAQDGDAENRAKPHHAKPRYKKPQPATTPKAEKTATLKTKAPTVSKEQTELKAIQPDQLVVGATVLVKLGASPMKATVIELVKQDVVVQLNSGMVVKTQRGSLFQA